MIGMNSCEKIKKMKFTKNPLLLWIYIDLTLLQWKQFLPNTQLHSISDFLFQRVSQISKMLNQVLSHFCICNKSL